MMVTTANLHDSKGRLSVIRFLKELCVSLKVILSDGRYREDITEAVKSKFGYVIEVVAGNFKVQGFVSTMIEEKKCIFVIGVLFFIHIS
jgi:hypothetical protein